MTGRMPASDQIVLLLALVPYLREHGPTPLHELANTFAVEPATLKKLVTFLGTAGIPGETLAYQHNDLFDLDWNALEQHNIVSLTQTVAIDETPRFTGAEAAALIGGLHALTPMLSAADAKVARGLAERIAAAMNLRSEGAVAVSAETPDETLVTLVQAIETRRIVKFGYRDFEGTRSERTVRPLELTQREGVWYLRGFDIERDAERTFRVPQMSELVLGEILDSPVSSDPSGDSGTEGGVTPENLRDAETLGEGDSEGTEARGRESIEIFAHVPTRLLPTIRGFAPTVVSAPEVPEGSVLVSIEAWHPGAAVRLAQHGPGAIEIIAPPAARAAVSDWTEAALEAYRD